MLKKLLTLFLAIVMLISAFALQAFPETVGDAPNDGGVGDAPNDGGVGDEPIEGGPAINDVAIGDVTYPTLKEAIAAAKPNDTVKLQADIESSEIIVIEKAIVLDGDGYKLTSTADRAINVSGADGVTIKNLTIEASGERAINVIQSSTNVTVEKVTATAKNYTVNVASSAPNAVVSITECNLTGLNVVNIASEGANITVSNSTITCNDQSDAESYAALVLNKDATNGKITAQNVTFNITGDSCEASHAADGSQIVFDGCEGTIRKVIAIIEYGNYYHGFHTLSSALNYATPGETVKITQDVSEPDSSISVPNGVTLDLSGHTVTVKSLATFGNESSVIDSAEPTEKGLLCVARDNLTLSSSQYPMFPIWNELNTGYVFVDFRLHNVGLITDGHEDGSFTFWFRPSIGSDTAEYFKDGALDNGLSVSVNLELILASGEVSNETVSFAVSDELIADVYSGDSGNNVINLNVQGVTAKFKQANVKLVFTSDTGMTHTTQALESYVVNFAEQGGNV